MWICYHMSTSLVRDIQSSCKQKFGSQGILALLRVKAIEMARRD
jgi:hypothetical protein